MALTAPGILVSPFLDTIFDKLSSFIQSDSALKWGVKKEMVKLSMTVSSIQAVLFDAEEKQIHNKSICFFLRKLKDLAYDLDDLLDECEYDSLQLLSQTKGKSIIHQVHDSLKRVTFRPIALKQVLFCLKFFKRITELREKFGEMAAEKSMFNLQMGNVKGEFQAYHVRETSSSISTEPIVYGREEDKEIIVALLLNNVMSHEDISVCPIVGMGGLGKTTLAQLVYNDARIQEHFKVRIWVCVSDNFDLKGLMKQIISCISRVYGDLEELDALHYRLQEELRGKRYLLVLDDVWNDKFDEWNRLKSSLAWGAKGSSIVVTTRLETVASITGTVPAYHMQLLSHEDCWSLFKNRAFGLRNEERPALLDIGKTIVRKCGGVPLAAKALGSLLRFKTEESEWLLVRNSEIWHLPETHENNILPVLKLSYNHLPSHIKQCFLYCSIFPKNHDIQKEELILLWIANGLVQPERTLEVEEVGNQIFNKLVLWSFFQDTRRDEDGTFTWCKMHDLVHDLASYVASDECLAMDIEMPQEITRTVRHLSLFSSKQQPSSIPELILESSQCLRSLIPLDFTLPIDNLGLIFSSLVHLRALDLSGTSAETLPNSIGRMKHLRYLNLYRACIKSLPESICGLRILQTLRLKECRYLLKLPTNMRKMTSLRHLEIQKCDGLLHMPTEIGHLTSLKTLSTFIVGLESGRQINELQGINLEGELEIKRLEHVKSLEEAREANLTRKSKLRSLKLSWQDSHLPYDASVVTEGLQPHSNLRQVIIEGYIGVSFPSWLEVSSLPNLVKIFLMNCTRCEHLPSLGKLPFLKVLNIYSMESVRFIENDIYEECGVVGFPSLEELELNCMPNLEGWSSSSLGGTLIPSLKSLILKKCPKLTAAPFSVSLEKVSVCKCSEMILGSLQNLPCLSYLSIGEFDELEYLPEGMLGHSTVLQRLQIYECPELLSLSEDMRNLSFLEELDLQNTPGLKYFPELDMSSLKHLKIYLESVTLCGLRYLPALQELHIMGWPKFEVCREDSEVVGLRRLTYEGFPKVTILPEGIKHATMLQSLTIECDPMELPDWIGHLVSLQELHLYCKNLKVLPKWIVHLTVLQSLGIHHCDPYLKRQLKKDTGEDWHMISHIPHFEITTE